MVHWVSCQRLRDGREALGMVGSRSVLGREQQERTRNDGQQGTAGAY